MTIPIYRAKALSPIIPVADLQRSIDFYTKVLGFEIARQSDEYSILTREAASLHLQRADGPAALNATRCHLSFYLEVEAIEPLWSHVSHFQDRHQIRAPFDRDYGMREFHIIDPDGCLIFVGQQTHSPDPSGRDEGKY